MAGAVSGGAERWERVQELLRGAEGLGEEERASYLAEACAEDADLKREVEELLVSAGEAEVYFGGLAGRLGVDLRAGEREEGALEGRVVGSYRLIRLIGRGGMGAVYLAERADGQFEKQVALKLLPIGMDSEDARRRFLAERQLLAGLEHPNIARLFDGGISEDGTPYFAMEWVDGRPIDRYCDEERLPVRERLALFGQVCRAVQYAHQNLVVHRDLKPSNVLVTPEGGVRLLDFGIAKLLADESGGEAEQTVTAARMMTPRFAAPEQLLGGPITTATDAYALGVLLYHLTTGVSPYRGGSGSPLEMERAVLEEEPLHPSAAVVTSDRIAEVRATTPEALRRRLRGDLDNIVLKALQKEPERRYHSAQQLLDDLERHRRGLPVEARPGTAGYRLRKFVRRHWRAVSVSAAAAVALVAFGVTMSVQRRATDRALQRAELERETAEQVAAFMEGMFAAANPYGASSERLDTLRISAVLGRGAVRAREELAGQPEVLIRLLRAIGRSYRLLPDLEAASATLEEAVRLSRATYGGHHPELATSLYELGLAMMVQRRPGEAEALQREALAIREAALGEHDPAVIRSLTSLATLLARQGDPDEADSLVDVALARLRAGPLPDSALLANALVVKGTAASAKRDNETAVQATREALSVYRSLLGPEHPTSLGVLNNLALFTQRSGRLGDAEGLFRDLVASYRSAFGPEHPYVAYVLAAHARVLSDLGRREEAGPSFAEAVATLRAHPPTPVAADVLFRYAGFLRAGGEVSAAERMYRDAIDMMEAATVEGSPAAERIKLSLADLLCETGRQRAGSATFSAALDNLSRALPSQHRDVERARRGLADCRAAAADGPARASPGGGDLTSGP